jgi:hypothetical protein
MEMKPTNARDRAEILSVHSNYAPFLLPRRYHFSPPTKNPGIFRVSIRGFCIQSVLPTKAQNRRLYANPEGRPKIRQPRARTVSALYHFVRDGEKNTAPSSFSARPK